HQHEHRADRQRYHQAETQHANAAEEQHGHGRAHHHHGGAEVRLQEQQTGHRQQHHERFEEAHPAFAHFLLTAHQIASQIDHHEHLGNFRRLHVEGTEADPAPRTVDLAADTGNQHQHQQAEGRQQHHPAITLPETHGDHQHDAGGPQTDDQVNQVANHVVK